MKKKKPEPIAVLAQKAEAIDFTQVYYIRLLKPLKKGQVLRFDTANDNLYLNESSSPTM